MPIRPLFRFVVLASLTIPASASGQCQIQTIPDPGAPNPFFGQVVTDGEHLGIADNSSQQPYIHLYERVDGQWLLAQSIAGPPGVAFGRSFALEGDVLAIGVPGYSDEFELQGAVLVYRKQDGIWIEEETLLSDDPGFGDLFGFSVALDGGTLVSGAAQADNPSTLTSGRVFVFEQTNRVFQLSAVLNSPMPVQNALFGCSVAIEDDTLVVGEPGLDVPQTNVGAVTIFEKNGDTWHLVFRMIGRPLDDLGQTVALFGDTAAVHSSGFSSSAPGVIEILVRQEGVWTESQTLTPPAPVGITDFGQSIAITESALLAGAPFSSINGQGSGAVYLFRPGISGWETAGLIEPDAVGAGHSLGSVAAHDDFCALGAGGADVVFAFAGLRNVDCNSNGLSDGCDIAQGTSGDLNGNAVPDECEDPDLDQNGSVDVLDLLALLARWGRCPTAALCIGDLNQDGRVGARDLLLLLRAWS